MLNNPDGGKTPGQHTRLEMMKGSGEDYSLGVPKSCEYILDAFLELGCCRVSDVGSLPLEFREVLSYSQATHKISQGWEISLIVEMSSEFIEGRERGRNPFSKFPKG